MRALLLFAVVDCTRPPAPPGPSLTPSDIYTELVEAGCLAPSPDGVQAIADEHALVGDPWLSCLFEGGTISKCGVPCK